MWFLIPDNRGHTTILQYFAHRPYSLIEKLLTKIVLLWHSLVWPFNRREKIMLRAFKYVGHAEKSGERQRWMQGTGIPYEELFHNYLQSIIFSVLRIEDITL